MLSERQRYQLDRRGEPHGVQFWGVAEGQPEGSNGGFLLIGQNYSPGDKVAVITWIYQRANGYPGAAPDA